MEIVRVSRCRAPFFDSSLIRATKFIDIERYVDSRISLSASWKYNNRLFFTMNQSRILGIKSIFQFYQIRSLFSSAN